MESGTKTTSADSKTATSIKTSPGGAEARGRPVDMGSASASASGPVVETLDPPPQPSVKVSPDTRARMLSSNVAISSQGPSTSQHLGLLSGFSSSNLPPFGQGSSVAPSAGLPAAPPSGLPAASVEDILRQQQLLLLAALSQQTNSFSMNHMQPQPLPFVSQPSLTMPSQPVATQQTFGFPPQQLPSQSATSDNFIIDPALLRQWNPGQGP